ncbi:site-specific integrase [Tenacibaculum aquimarinum]|uniref:site-specific integrase n=1 Tax=Tenacibaculum aquimarinum TaxID=2910675 RepID=UPI001F0ADF57|nr:site-specific integrase [Tenacibaculum aquimarinum]MCH3881714.1 site-specific integrase [Tenacibaculum aquimarinum]
MASVKFLLRNKKATKSVTIYYAVNLAAKSRIRGATKLKIHPRYWDDRNQKVRNMSDVSNIKDNINKKLSDFKSFILKKITEYNSYENAEIELQLKKDINIYFGKKTIEKKLTLYTFSRQFIDQSKNRIIDSTGRTLSIRTINEYERTIDLLKDFEKKYNYSISFESINMDFYGLFIEYLEGLDFSLNTIGKFIKQLKVFMNAATEENLNTNLSFQSKRFIKPSAKSTQVYLNEVELKKIIDIDYSDNPTHNNARDLFIIGAYTGLRVSDFNGLTKNNIHESNGKRFFRVIVKKTGKYLPIPIHPIVENILEKNDGNPPKRMPEQHINLALKKIAAKAKLNEEITITKTKGGKEITETKKKHQLISNHTSRRSFCTNAYFAGMPTLDIMAISGHTSEKVFLNYIRITEDERALKISENSFFKVK